MTVAGGVRSWLQDLPHVMHARGWYRLLLGPGRHSTRYTHKWEMRQRERPSPAVNQVSLNSAMENQQWFMVISAPSQAHDETTIAKTKPERCSSLFLLCFQATRDGASAWSWGPSPGRDDTMASRFAAVAVAGLPVPRLMVRPGSGGCQCSVPPRAPATACSDRSQLLSCPGRHLIVSTMRCHQSPSLRRGSTAQCIVFLEPWQLPANCC